MKKLIFISLFFLLIGFYGCTTISSKTVQEKPPTTVIGDSKAADEAAKKKSSQQSSDKDKFSIAKETAAGASNAVNNGVKGIGDGIWWFFSELLKPFNALREGFIDLFGVPMGKPVVQSS